MNRYITYCSFAEPGLCRGVVVLAGKFDPIEACRLTHKLGINPGGQMAVVTGSDEDIPGVQFSIFMSNTNRLISAEEARKLFNAKTCDEWDELKRNAN